MGRSIARRLLLAGMPGVLLAAAPGQARPLDEVLKARKLRVGVNPALPPLARKEAGGELEGFDVDIARRIAQMLGVELELVEVATPDRLAAVVSGRVDAVMGGLTRTPERAKSIDFTVPVHTEILGVLTLEGRPFRAWRELDDDRVTLVQVRGTTPVQWIEANAPKAKVLLLGSHAEALRALAQGQGDAMVDVIDFLGPLMNETRAVKWRVLEPPIDIYYCALGVAKGSQSLKDWLNVAIFELHRSGFIDRSWERWFGARMFAPTGATPFF